MHIIRCCCFFFLVGPLWAAQAGFDTAEEDMPCSRVLDATSWRAHAGAPGSGKTALALGIAQELGTKVSCCIWCHTDQEA